MNRITPILYFIFLIEASSYAQNLKKENCEIKIINDTNTTGYYLKPPSTRYPNIYFGIHDTSLIELKILHAEHLDAVLSVSEILPRGNYCLDWYNLNLLKLKSGLYFVKFDATSKNFYGRRNYKFNSTSKFIIIK